MEGIWPYAAASIAAIWIAFRVIRLLPMALGFGAQMVFKATVAVLILWLGHSWIGG